MAREIGYPAGEVLALMELSQAAGIADDPGRAVPLARQAEQIMADIPARIGGACSANLTSVLIAAGDMAAAEGVCSAPTRRRPWPPTRASATMPAAGTMTRWSPTW